MKPDEIPDTESLATTLERVLPYWEKNIATDIKSGKKVLVSILLYCAFWCSLRTVGLML